MKKPSTRKEIIDVLIQKKGYEYTSILTLALKDSNLKKHFDRLWKNGLKGEVDYIPSDIEPSICLRCKSEVEYVSYCDCGENMAVIDVAGFNPDEVDDQKFKAEYLKDHPGEL